MEGPGYAAGHGSPAASGANELRHKHLMMVLCAGIVIAQAQDKTIVAKTHMSAIEARDPEAIAGECLRLRNAGAQPLLEPVHEWLQASLAELTKKSETASAIQYAQPSR